MHGNAITTGGQPCTALLSASPHTTSTSGQCLMCLIALFTWHPQTDSTAPEGVPDHARVSRSGNFQSFVLRSCINLLEAANSSESLSKTISGVPRGRAQQRCERQKLLLLFFSHSYTFAYQWLAYKRHMHCDVLSETLLVS